MALLAALAGAGLAVFLALALALPGGRAALAGDAAAFGLARDLSAEWAVSVVSVATHLGSSPVMGLLTLLTARWAARRGRRTEAGVLVVGFLLLMAAVYLAKAAEGRPRPVGAMVDTLYLSYPSGHAAYSVALTACAVVWLGGRRRPGVLVATAAFALAVAASRVYLRAHYLSDVAGGLALAVAVFALTALGAMLAGAVRHNRT